MTNNILLFKLLGIICDVFCLKMAVFKYRAFGRLLHDYYIKGQKLGGEFANLLILN